MIASIKLNEVWQTEDAAFENDYDLLENQIIFITVTHLPTKWDFTIKIKATDVSNDAVPWVFWGPKPRPKKIFRQFKDVFSTDFVGHIRLLCLMLIKTYHFDSMKDIVKKAAWWDAVHGCEKPLSFTLPTKDAAFDRMDMDIHTPVDKYVFYGNDPDDLQEISDLINWVLNTYCSPLLKILQANEPAVGNALRQDDKIAS